MTIMFNLIYIYIYIHYKVRIVYKVNSAWIQSISYLYFHWTIGKKLTVTEYRWIYIKMILAQIYMYYHWYYKHFIYRYNKLYH